MEKEQRLIDANALSEKIGNMKFEITHNRGGYRYCNEDEKSEWDKLDGFDSLVCDAPTVDAVEVVHGRWKHYHKQNIAVCTNCSFERKLDADFGKAVSCPNCGAKMDGGNEDGN